MSEEENPSMAEASDDEPQKRWNARKAAKSAVTRKENDILHVMCSFSEDDLKIVRAKRTEMVDTIKRFRQQHMDYHLLLTDNVSKKKSEEYYEEVEARYVSLLERISNYERSVELKMNQSEDGVSAKSDRSHRSHRSSKSGGSRSQSSRHSGRSSVSSARIKATAKKATLEAEIAALDKQQKLDDEEMKLHEEEMKLRDKQKRLSLKREKLHLETEKAKVEAEESILAEAENEQKGSVSTSKPPVGGATGVTSEIRAAMDGSTVMQMSVDSTLGGATGGSLVHHLPLGGAVGQQLQASSMVNGTTTHHSTHRSSHVYAPTGGAASLPTQLNLPTGGAQVISSLPDGALVNRGAQHLQIGGATTSSLKNLPPGGAGASPDYFLPSAAVTMPQVHLTADGAHAMQGNGHRSGTRTQLNPNAPVWPGILQSTAPLTSTSAHQNSRPVPELVQSSSDDSLLQVLHQGQQQQRQLLNAIQIPKVEIAVFDGDPMKYWTFIRTFENSVEKDTVDSNSRLSRLLQYTSGKALKVIQSCAIMHPDERYRRAKELLQERFGNPYTITETWIGHVTNGQAIKPHERQKLQDFADELRSCTETLKAMGNSAEINAQSSLVKIISRLPIFLQNKWKQEVRHIRKNYHRNPSIEDVTSFVLEGAEVANDPVYGGITDVQRTSFRSPNQSFVRRSTNYNVLVQQPIRDSVTSNSYRDTPAVYACLKCGGSHSLFGCDAFKAMRLNDRVTFALEKRLCFNCLRPGHVSSRCGLRRVCSVPGCNMKHTKFLHQIVSPARSADNPQETIRKTVYSEQQQEGQGQESQSGFVKLDSQENFGVNRARGGENMRIALPIVPVVVRAPGNQRCVTTYALLDTGSNSTFCSEELMKELGLSGDKELLCLTTLEKQNSKVETMSISLEVSDVAGEIVLQLPVVYSRPSLPVNLDNLGKPEDLSKWNHLRDVDLPRINAEKVTLLIGQDNPEALVPTDLRKGAAGEPYATKTVFGWTLNGPLGGVRRHVATANFVHVDRELNEQLAQFWKVEGPEALVQEKRGLSFEDKRVVELWEESIQHSDGHYVLPKPFRQRPPYLPPNRVMAEKRLESLHRRLSRDASLHAAYTGFMEDLFEKGYAEKVKEDEVDKSEMVWYLPHHNVVNPKKPDKVRIVFDCKATHQGVSINSQVMQGPDLMNSLFGVLLRFRQFPVAIMSDVEAMYHQVRVPPQDRDVLRFLWWPGGDLKSQPEVFRMTVHLFGGVWSASCCNFALQRAAEDNRQRFDHETVMTVLRDFYVDDCLKSLMNDTQAIRMVDQLGNILQQGGFHLTKWISNSREVLKTIDECDKAKPIKGLDLNFEALPTERALGVYWNIESDCFRYKITMQEKPLTKRGLLSVVSSVYDPLGFVCPYTIIAKKILQELTREKRGWDEALPDDVLRQWLSWKQDLQIMEKMKVPRCVQSTKLEAMASIQLHHFSDASTMAYGAASYLRLQYVSGKVRCFLLMAKSRLAPIKQLTIPRLELTAATLSVRLDHMIRRELTLSIDTSTFWTDSMCVLRYISSEDKRFHTYVENRVSVIREGSSPAQWLYVESKLNSADDASRGLGASEMISRQRWLEGPGFLKEEEINWPKTPDLKQIQEEDPEVKKVKVCLVQKGQPESLLERLIKRRSSWMRLKKDVAWILRLKQWLQAKCNPSVCVAKGPITVDETDQAELEIVKFVQNEHFKEDITELSQNVNKSVKKSSRLFKLAPVLTSKGVLVVGGRLKSAPISERAKHPMILPKSHHVIDLIISETHEQSGHSGREYVLSELRQIYWIVSARPAVRRVLNNCFKCRKNNAKPCDQQMANLPVPRVTPEEPPFTYVGVDYFGTFYVKRGRSEVKRYGCLFTCLTARAVHIEVAHSLDTSSFVNALQRFISRRGKPKVMYSDNGTNFVGAEREMKEAIVKWNQVQINNYLHQNGVQWKFNPPAASHMGGVWERLIRSVRKVLRGVMKEQTLDDENLSTLLCIVEAVINGRPLTAVSDDPNDLEALTPNHLLLLRTGVVLPPGAFDKSDLYSRRRWRQVQYLANVFWRRWLKEYLPALQSRQKWLLPKRNLAVGDLVIVVDDDTPRSVWPVARVVDTFAGKDGLVRSVQIKSRNSTLVRPINKVCLLEEVKQ